MNVTGTIISAIMAELKYFLNGQGTYLLDTQLKSEVNYEFPLVIFDVGNGGDSAQYPGNGLTRIDYDLTFRVYNYEPNAYDDEDYDYSSSLMDIIDNLRTFLENETWLTNKMVDLVNNFGFKMTFQGMNKAENLQSNEVLIMGYSLSFASVAFDPGTLASNDIEELTGNVSGETIINGEEVQ
jgi:hypothetical protein